MTKSSIFQELIEVIEDACDTFFDLDDSEFSKAMGLNEAMAEKLKDSIEILVRYKDYMPSDVLKSIQDVIKFAMKVSEKSDDETKDEEKIKKSHEWGFSLMPANFEKEEESRSRRTRRKKTGKHQWGFSLSNSEEDIKKEGEEDLEENEEDEEDED